MGSSGGLFFVYQIDAEESPTQPIVAPCVSDEADPEDTDTPVQKTPCKPENAKAKTTESLKEKAAQGI